MKKTSKVAILKEAIEELYAGKKCIISLVTIPVSHKNLSTTTQVHYIKLAIESAVYTCLVQDFGLTLLTQAVGPIAARQIHNKVGDLDELVQELYDNTLIKPVTHPIKPVEDREAEKK